MLTVSLKSLNNFHVISTKWSKRSPESPQNTEYQHGGQKGSADTRSANKASEVLTLVASF